MTGSDPHFSHLFSIVSGNHKILQQDEIIMSCSNLNYIHLYRSPSHTVQSLTDIGAGAELLWQLLWQHTLGLPQLRQKLLLAQGCGHALRAGSSSSWENRANVHPLASLAHHGVHLCLSVFSSFHWLWSKLHASLGGFSSESIHWYLAAVFQILVKRKMQFQLNILTYRALSLSCLLMQTIMETLLVARSWLGCRQWQAFQQGTFLQHCLCKCF